MPLTFASSARTAARSLPFALALALSGCNGCGAASDAGTPADAGELACSIATTEFLTSGFLPLTGGDPIEIVLGHQLQAMIYLRYVVPADATTELTATLTVAPDGLEPFERVHTGLAEPEPGVDGRVMRYHRIAFNDIPLFMLEGRGVRLDVSITDALGRAGTASFTGVLRDLVPCQDLGPGLCLPYGDWGVDGGLDSGTADAAVSADAATDAGP